MGRLMAAVYDRMMRQTERACLARWRAEILSGLRGTVLEVGAGTGSNLQYYPAAVTRLVLCSVGSLDGALAEIHRVLKPGGRFVFLEHVAAETRRRRLWWQRRLEPIWRRAAGNCHLTRRTGEALPRAGFRVETMTRESMRRALPVVRPTIRGNAVKPASPAGATSEGG